VDDRSLIDASVRDAGDVFLYDGATWLLAATLIGFVCSIKLHWRRSSGTGASSHTAGLAGYTNILVYGGDCRPASGRRSG